MRTEYYVVFLFVIISCTVFSQSTDTIYGKPKRIREKVVFLTGQQNPQMLYYDDYGHCGFRGPEITIAQFKNVWFSTEFCYYLNYERHFDKQGKISKDVWYSKGDTLLRSYRYSYNQEGKLVTGNWKEIVKSVDGTPMYKWIRSIEYYK